jgi:hypothetical protein
MMPTLTLMDPDVKADFASEKGQRKKLARRRLNARLEKGYL